MIKMSQNIVEGSFSITVTQICKKKTGEIWPQVPFNNQRTEVHLSCYEAEVTCFTNFFKGWKTCIT